MDIINPAILIIGKRYYRQTNCKLSLSNEKNDSEHEDISNRRWNNYDEDFCDYEEEIKSEFPITRIGKDYCCQIDVASMFYGFIIGKKGETKKRIELDTKTTVEIPKEGGEGKVKVRGESFESVDRALNRIRGAVERGRQLTPFTHFLSISAANSETVRESFCRLKRDILSHCIGDRGVTENLFQKPQKLHLTLAIVVIGDHRELEDVKEILCEFNRSNEDLLRQAMRIRIRGLEIMNDDAREARVLFAKVDRSLDREKLQSVADRLTMFLMEKQIIPKVENSSVNLHMTLLNTSFLYEKDLALDSTGNNKNRETFDCSNILKKYVDWDFGEIEVNEIYLSKRHGIVSDGYYSSAASIKFGQHL